MSTTSRGQYLKKIAKERGFGLQEVADLTGYTRDTIYRWFKNENLDWKKMKIVADVIGYDVSRDFPETELEYKKGEQLTCLEKCKQQELIIKELESKFNALEKKYSDLLEEHLLLVKSPK